MTFEQDQQILNLAKFNIRSDYRNGKISFLQFKKEMYIAASYQSQLDIEKNKVANESPQHGDK